MYQHKMSDHRPNQTIMYVKTALLEPVKHYQWNFIFDVQELYILEAKKKQWNILFY